MVNRLECQNCGITPGDLPHEEMGMSVEDFADMFFEWVDTNIALCQGCANGGTP